MSTPASTVGGVYKVDLFAHSLPSGTNEPAARAIAGIKGRIFKITAGIAATAASGVAFAGTGVQFMVTNAGTDVTAASLAIVGATTLANTETIIAAEADVAEDATLALNVNSIGGIVRGAHAEVWLTRE